MNKKQLAIDLGISRKTLYNYLEELRIKELTDNNILKLKDYVKDKNKSKEISKAFLLSELEELRLKNAELIKQNETLEKGQAVLLDQVEYFRNDLNNEIRTIKQNMTLLLEAPKEEKKKGFISRLFK